MDVTFGTELAKCYIEWRRTSFDEIDKPEFEHAVYRVKDGETRTIRLLAPWDHITESDPTVTISITGDPSVSLLTRTGRFEFDEARGCAVSVFRVRGRRVGSRVRLTAIVGESTAETELVVTAGGVGGIKIEIDELNIDQQAIIMDEGARLKVNAKHQAVARYLGSKHRGYPGQDKIHFRTMLAEIVAATFSRWVVQQRRQERAEPSRLFYEQLRIMNKWLPRVHAILVPAKELGTASED